MAAHAEGRIERRLVNRVEASGGLAFKLTDRVGIPDRLCVWPNKPPVFVEVKTETGQLRKAQLYWGQRLESQGYSYAVVRTPEDVDRVVAWAESRH